MSVDLPIYTQSGSFPFTGNWQTLEYNMVPTKYFQQFLKDLKNPEPYSVKSQYHWRVPILCSSTRKVIYRFFYLGIIKHALAKQNIVTLKERALWNGHVLVTEHEKQGDTDRVQALLAAKRKAHGSIPIARIMCMSNLIIGYREGLVTREIDVIWWSNLYHTSLMGKMSIRLFVSHVHLE